jgi:hypothetical protein
MSLAMTILTSVLINMDVIRHVSESKRRRSVTFAIPFS